MVFLDLLVLFIQVGTVLGYCIRYSTNSTLDGFPPPWLYPRLQEKGIQHGRMVIQNSSTQILWTSLPVVTVFRQIVALKVLELRRNMTGSTLKSGMLSIDVSQTICEATYKLRSSVQRVILPTNVALFKPYYHIFLQLLLL